MTELGERFVAALRGQGFGIIFQDDDAVVLGAGGGWRHHVPMVILTDPALEVLLRLAIVTLSQQHPEVSARWLTGGAEPGRN
jgi:hypothetical protein